MRIQLVYWLLAGMIAALLALPASAKPPKRDAKDSEAIQKNGEAFIEAFHKGDAKALAAFWTDDGDYTDQSGHNLKGRNAIEKAFAEFFAENKGAKLRINSNALRFATPDVAIEDGTTEVLPADGVPPTRAQYTIVHVRTDGQWQLSSVRESAFVPPSNRTNLRGLEKFVGDWAQEQEKGHVERLSIAWADNENFVIATFATTVGNMSIGKATQWIGWDPVEKRVRSWIFDAAGGFGEGSWTKDGDKWVIKTTSTLQDGKKATATYVVSAVDPDTVTLEAKDRTIEGKPIPDTKEIKLKRVK
jgi:uncharacterized protein (TIGR02246 family)